MRSAIHRIQCITYRICMHMYILHDGRIQSSITCTSRYIHVNMTHPMYQSGCHGVTPQRHRYGFNGVTPYVIAIYRTCIYCRADIATWQSRDHDSFLYIVRVLLGQTIDDSSYVFKWLPWSNPFTSSIWLPWSNLQPLCHRYL